jgi:hypothetical protein
MHAQQVIPRVMNPGRQLKRTITGGRPNISQRHKSHNRTYTLDYVLSDLQLSSIEKGLKILRREIGEKPPREVRKELRLGFTSQNNLCYLQLVIMETTLWTSPTVQGKAHIIFKLFMYYKT